MAAPKAVSPPKKASPKPLAVSTSDPELVLDRDPLASSSRSSVSTVPAESSAESTTPPKEEVDREEEPQQENKPKRGRKTLPAASSSADDSELPKPAPKTPGRKTMAAAPAPVAALEEPGSSRSGRKIKPKKFFDDAEATAAVTKSAAKPVKPETSATPAGRGKRKTIAPVVSSEEEEDEKQKKKKQNDDEDEPKASVSREEIMAIVGDFQDEAPPAVVTEDTEAEPING